MINGITITIDIISISIRTSTVTCIMFNMNIITMYITE